MDAIPASVERIAFLDSNYAYDQELRHHSKLADWLNADPDRALIVFAYDDANALLNGKSFVSASGGTWGRSFAMAKDLGISFSTNNSTLPWRYEGLTGRVQLLLIPNPERKIYHTQQVERNGFIHALLANTPQDSRGYRYWGERAYGSYISSIQD
jgi:hypothetical protein